MLSNEDYWTWKTVFAQDIRSNTKIYRDYKKKGHSHIDVYSLTSNALMFHKLNQGSLNIIKNEIGIPNVQFNTIVGIESGGFIQGPILA